MKLAFFILRLYMVLVRMYIHVCNVKFGREIIEL
jgi:hypothetical protein